MQEQFTMQEQSKEKLVAIEKSITDLLASTKQMPLEEAAHLFFHLESSLKCLLPQVTKTVKTLHAAVKALDSE